LTGGIEMSVQASKSAIPAILDQEIEMSLKSHLVNHHERGKAVEIGTMEQLKGVVKIIDSPAISNAIEDYLSLPKRQYLVACVNNWVDIRVWGIYTANQIGAMQRNAASVNHIDWKILEIPEELEAQLRADIIDLSEITFAPAQSTTTNNRCTIL
jgi:hypothetical protein